MVKDRGFDISYPSIAVYVRKNNGISRRIGNAKFINKKFLEDFDKSKYSLELNRKFEYLETSKFVDNKENIILIGTPGCGKTHYATGAVAKL